MSDTVKTQQVYYTKDFSTYSNSEDNFVASQELTVTITLNEYRKLVKAETKAAVEVSEWKQKYWDKDREIKEMQSVIDQLKSKVYELQNPAANTEVQ